MLEVGYHLCRFQLPASLGLATRCDQLLWLNNPLPPAPPRLVTACLQIFSMYFTKTLFYKVSSRINIEKLFNHKTSIGKTVGNICRIVSLVLLCWLEFEWHILGLLGSFKQFRYQYLNKYKCTMLYMEQYNSQNKYTSFYNSTVY